MKRSNARAVRVSGAWAATLNDDRANPKIVLAAQAVPRDLPPAARSVWRRLAPQVDSAVAARGFDCRRSDLVGFGFLVRVVAFAELRGGAESWRVAISFASEFYLPASVVRRRLGKGRR
jgi:hypothetical protein